MVKDIVFSRRQIVIFLLTAVLFLFSILTVETNNDESLPFLQRCPTCIETTLDLFHDFTFDLNVPHPAPLAYLFVLEQIIPVESIVNSGNTNRGPPATFSS
jgi:hypothetical protein